ncbi:MAG: hypothetical protein JSS65_12530 [Armatimonadetes bacterium]|nr:hypothetical protein [Armatimonadota bacterium]
MVIASILYLACSVAFYAYAVKTALPFDEGRPALQLVVNSNADRSSDRLAA